MRATSSRDTGAHNEKLWGTASSNQKIVWLHRRHRCCEQKKGFVMTCMKQSCGHTFISCAATMAASRRVKASGSFQLTGMLKSWCCVLGDMFWDVRSCMK